MAKVSIGRLPVTNRELFGRETELDWLDACWRDGVHVASIVAWGGVGKSALVNRWLARVRDDGWRGAEKVFAWSFYSQGTDRLSSSDEFVEAALRWFGDPDPRAGSPWDKGERLAGLVGERRALLVLDGVEPLQWGPGVQVGRLKDHALEALVKELGAKNNGLCLITSRLGVTDLEPLVGDRVQETALGPLSTEAGAELLRARGAKGADEELRRAAAEYKGHGLALTLLGSYLEEVAEGDIRRRREVGPLEADERVGGHARRVMAAYEAWFRRGPEVAILHVMGLFDRPADEEELAALRAYPPVLGLTDTLEGISEHAWNRAVVKLRRAGLLAEEGRRLDAHPLVREHFGEQLRQEQPKAWREGHRRLYEHLKQKAEERPETIEEMAPLYMAVVHGCLAGKSQEAVDEVLYKRIRRESAAFSVHELGAFGSEVATCAAFFDPPWERLAPGLDEDWGAWVLTEAGFALRALGRLPDAAGLMRLSLQQFIAQENWEYAARIACNLGELLQTNGELSEALSYAQQSVEFADKSGNAFMRMGNRTIRAATNHELGRREAAAAQFEEAEQMQLEREPAYRSLYSIQGFLYCDLLLDQGREAQVLIRATRTLKWWGRGTYSLLEIALDHLALGRAHVLSLQRGTGGNLAEATVHLQKTVDGFRRAARQDVLPLGLLARAALHLHTSALTAARHDLDAALSLATRCGFRLHECDAHLALTRLTLAECNPTAAHAHLAAARALITATGYHRRDPELAELTTILQAHPLPSPAPRPLPLSPPKRPPAMPSPTHIDFLLITALEEERDALLSLLPNPRKLDRDRARDGAHTYYEATLPTRRRDGAAYRIIATTLSGMGPTKAALKASTAAARWKPSHVLLVGIAGAVSGEAAPGDVMVASQVVDYTLGKVRDAAVREERWTAFPADADLLDAAVNFPTGWRDLLTATPPITIIPTRRIGVIASGGDVVASPAQIAVYRADWPKLLGVEMEGGGVASGLHDDVERPRFLMIRGVSDLADATDNAATKAAWRAYACHVAAAYAIGLLRDGPVAGGR